MTAVRGRVGGAAGFALATGCAGLAAVCACKPAPPVSTAAASSPSPPVLIDYDADGTARASAPAYDPDTPLFPGANYDARITAPEACLGHAIGARIAPPDRIVACFRRWADESPRAQIAPYATSYEGRELVRVVIASEANAARIEAIAKNLARLADPRGLSAADAERLIADTPAVGWFGYSIHGDEVSGADASVAFGYQLIAGTGADVARILDSAVIVIDPVMNPDGRQRILTQIDQARSLVASTNDVSMHRGRWPWGRGNHYLFDMNRDWIAGVAPETRGRWQAILAMHPQLVVDAHEMGSQDTYLFYPQAEPINRNLPPTLGKWQQAFSVDHGRAFDRHGWAYYTREWADGWYPGYSDAWAGLTGAIGILYEQASTSGQPLLRASGALVSYREAVHAQAVSSVTNATTLANNREAILRDYAAFRRAQVQPTRGDRVFALRAGVAPDREHRLLLALIRQGVEVYRATRPVVGQRAETALGQRAARIELPAGSYLIPVAQPQRAVVQAVLAFDPRIDDAVLQAEREKLEREGQSKLYDVTAWSLGHAFALDVYWIDPPRDLGERVTALAERAGEVVAASGATWPAVAWIVDGRDDASVAFAAHALEAGAAVHVGDEAVTAGGSRARTFARGSVLIRRRENQRRAAAGVSGGGALDIEQIVAAAARRAGVRAYALATGRSPDDGPDLGGRHFQLLHRPRIAVLSNSPVRPTGFGHVWEHIDRELALPMTMLDAQALGRVDLRRYNVLVIPEVDGGLAPLLAAHAESLAAWVRSGGTLIALGSAAAVVAKAELKLSQVRLRRDALAELGLYQAAVARELAARKVELDTSALWDEPERPATGQPTPTPTGRPGAAGATGDGKPGAKGASGDGKSGGDGKPGGKGGKPDPAAVEADAWQRRFSPRGAVLRGLVDPAAWLGFGVGAELPVLVRGSHAFLSRAPVATPVRLAPARGLRLSGLLWPEARARLAETAYATVEPVGAGQVILFAQSPVLRGMTRGTARLFSNAVVYGPGLGARQPRVW